MEFNQPIPILRSFDESNAKDFYLNFLGFKLDWEHRFEDGTPLYMQVSLGDCILHISEHHGDGTPGTFLRIKVTDLDALQKDLLGKQYKYARPGIQAMPWGTRDMAIADPFGNKLIFSDG